MNPGRKVYWRNALVSSAFLLPAMALFPGTSWSAFIWSFIGGFLWADWFEYAYHRWELHNVSSNGEQRHRGHHRNPDNEATVNLGGGWLTVFLLFTINGMPLLALDGIFNTHIFSGAMTAFVAFFLLTEEFHWRAHLGGWIPFNIGRAHHRWHHKRSQKNYNIWLPIFDYLLRTKE